MRSRILLAAAQVFQQGPVPTRTHHSATYAVQLAGREQGVAQTCDLGNVPRQMPKFKIGMEF